jgi:hypothetical protein
VGRKRIVVNVLSDGTIAASTDGYTGSTCLDEVARIEGLCGGTVVSSSLTDDYHAADAAGSLITHAEVNEET